MTDDCKPEAISRSIPRVMSITIPELPESGMNFATEAEDGNK